MKIKQIVGALINGVLFGVIGANVDMAKNDPRYWVGFVISVPHCSQYSSSDKKRLNNFFIVKIL